MYWDSDMKVLNPGVNRDRLRSWCNGEPTGDTLRMTPEQRKAWDENYAPREEFVRSHRMSDEEFESWTYQTYVKDYLSTVAAIDDNVGRVLDYLDDNGLTDNTIVVYCSDQGFFLGEHRWFDKRWMFDEAMMMPLIMRWPGRVKAGTVYEQLVQNIDYAPTFLEACGVEVPDYMHGRSMLRIIDDGEKIHDDLYYHYYMHEKDHRVPAHDGIRGERYKLLHYYTQNEFNLFDLERDPNEMRSFHDDPEYADILATMKARYYELRKIYEIPDEYGPNGKFSAL